MGKEKKSAENATPNIAFADSLGESEMSTGSSLSAPQYNASAQNVAQMQNYGDVGNFNGPGDGLNPHVGIGFSLSSNGWKVKVFADVSHQMGNFYGAAGMGLAYHNNFNNTGKNGFEMRSSLQGGFNDGTSRAALGTNLWTGFGEMSEFNQRTGYMGVGHGDFNLNYENDGTPMQWLGLGDGGDSYRTAALQVEIGEFSLDMNLLTGKRDQSSYDIEKTLPGGSKGLPMGEGQFGENYNNGFVVEQGPKYRMGTLTLNHDGKSLGIDSEWVRHYFQNVAAHDILKPQRQFPMTSGDVKPFGGFDSMPRSGFTLWD